jgi:hypothetical protein
MPTGSTTNSKKANTASVILIHRRSRRVAAYTNTDTAPPQSTSTTVSIVKPVICADQSMLVVAHFSSARICTFVGHFDRLEVPYTSSAQALPSPGS